MLKLTFKVTLSIGLFLISYVSVSAQQWITVKSESRFNFSGMAFVEQNETRKTFIVVHDNKDQLIDAPNKNKTDRAGLLIVENGALRPKYEKLKWIGADGTENSLPVDLEAISAIPDQPNRFLAGVGNPNAAEEKGRVYYIELSTDRKSVRVIKSFKRPTATDDRDFEGLAVQKIGGILIGFWTDRGKNEKPATLFWGAINLEKGSLNSLGEVAVKTPSPDLADFAAYPSAQTRSIADLKIDISGGAFVTSVVDGEDDGPFASAFYYIGSFSKQTSGVSFSLSPSPIKLYQFKNYKTEAFEFVPGKTGGVIFGTDDEDFGAAIFMNW